MEMRIAPRSRLLLAVVFLAPTRAAAQVPLTIPPEEQMRRAVTAAPPHLRQDAGVWVLEADGYRQARPSSNGFECLLERWELDNLTPICYDRVGAESTLRVVLFLEEQRALDRSEDDIRDDIERGYDNGRFLPPAGQGVAYMLSFESPAPPHVMYYAPYATNEAFGGAVGSARALMPFIYSPGTPRAYIIQLVDPDALRRLDGGG